MSLEQHYSNVTKDSETREIQYPILSLPGRGQVTEPLRYGDTCLHMHLAVLTYFCSSDELFSQLLVYVFNKRFILYWSLLWIAFGFFLLLVLFVHSKVLDMNSFPPEIQNQVISCGEIVLQIPGILKITAIRYHQNNSANIY